MSADPVADPGHHHVAFALFPHVGSPTAGGVIAETHACKNARRVIGLEASTGGESLPASLPLATVDDPGAMVAAIKAADDDEGTIVRLHDSFGGRRRVVVRVHGATSAQGTDLLEAPLPEPTCSKPPCPNPPPTFLVGETHQN